MKITRITGKEIFDSRGIPTVMCEMSLDDGTVVCAEVPSGTSKGDHEAMELRDGGSRLFGMGVSKAIHNIDHIIAPELIGKTPDVVIADALMRRIDPTSDKSILGANATLAVSYAVCRAQAAANGLHLFELISALYDTESVSLPFPYFNMVNGGAHADNQFPIQEIMIAPIGAQNFRVGLEAAMEVFHEFQKLLHSKGKSTAVGQEGGCAPIFSSYTEPFDLLTQAIASAGHEGTFVFGIDVAANQLYDRESGLYRWGKEKVTSSDLIGIYTELFNKYSLYSIEDGCSEHDVAGWQSLYAQLGESTQIAGDDLFVTNIEAIARGIENELAGAVIIKPNQVGTVTESLEAIELCHQAGLNPIISHRSGETTDTFIADLAVGTSAGQIKAGGCSRGERIAKYNRLLWIEDMLTMSALDDHSETD